MKSLDGKLQQGCTVDQAIRHLNTAWNDKHDQCVDAWHRECEAEAQENECQWLEHWEQKKNREGLKKPRSKEKGRRPKRRNPRSTISMKTSHLPASSPCGHLNMLYRSWRPTTTLNPGTSPPRAILKHSTTTNHMRTTLSASPAQTMSLPSIQLPPSRPHVSYMQTTTSTSMSSFRLKTTSFSS